MSRTAGIAVVALVALAAVWVKVRVESGRALDEAATRLAAGDEEAAVVSYSHALRWYSPFSGPVSDAVDALSRLALAAEAERPADALRTWRTLRSALFAVRHVSWPFEDALRVANEHILALSTAGLPAETVEKHRALLARDPSPNVGWSLVATLAFAAWTLTLFGVARRLLDDDGRLAWRAAAPWLAGFAGTAGVWMTALALA